MSQGKDNQDPIAAAEAAAANERRFCSLPAPAMDRIFAFIREERGLMGVGVASVVCKSWSEAGKAGHLWRSVDIDDLDASQPTKQEIDRPEAYVALLDRAELQQQQQDVETLKLGRLFWYLKEEQTIQRLASFQGLTALDFSNPGTEPYPDPRELGLGLSCRTLLAACASLPHLQDLSLRGVSLGLPSELFVTRESLHTEHGNPWLDATKIPLSDIQSWLTETTAATMDYTRVDGDTGRGGTHCGEELPMERVASLSRLDVRGARLSDLSGNAMLNGLMVVQQSIPAWALLPLLVSPARPVKELRLGWAGEKADDLPGGGTGFRMWFPEEPDAAGSEKVGGKTSLGNALAEALRDHAPSIEVFDWCGAMHMDGQLRHVLRRMTCLKELRMNTAVRISATTLISLRLRNLTTVNLRNVWCLGDDLLKPLACECPRLQRVNVSCTRVTDDALVAMARSCPEIVALDLCYSKVTETGVLQAADLLPGLVFLGVSGILGMSDQGVTRIAAQLTKLEFLALGGLVAESYYLVESRAQPREDITDAALLALCRHSKNLRELWLQDLLYVWDKGLEALMDQNRVKLMVKRCHAIGGSTMARLSQPEYRSMSEYNGDDV